MEIATKIAPIGLAIIMLTLGFGLTIKDFLRVFKIHRLQVHIPVGMYKKWRIDVSALGTPAHQSWDVFMPK